MSDEDRIMDEALRWHLASTADDMDWDGFTAWLEADGRHRRHYDAIALTDAMVTTHAAAVPGIADAPKPRRWRWAGVAIAASLVAMIGVGWELRATETVYATGSRARAIALADGSQIDLAPHSRLAVSANSSTMRLDGGAWFMIRHDPGRTLAITAGPVVVSDIGTRFDIQAEGNTVRVSVADGNVRVTSPTLDDALALGRGRALTFDGKAGRVTLNDIDPANAGAWRQGRLNYADVSLALVAVDLARYSNARIVMPSTLRDRHFSGTLITTNGNQPLLDLAQVMGLGVVRNGSGYRLVDGVDQHAR